MGNLGNQESRNQKRSFSSEQQEQEIKHTFVIHILTNILHEEHRQMEEAGASGNMCRYHELKERCTQILAAISKLEVAGAGSLGKTQGG